MEVNSSKEIVCLIIHSLVGDLNDSERAKLDSWLKDDENRAFYYAISQTGYVRNKINRLEKTDKSRAWQKLEMNMKIRLRNRKIKMLSAMVAAVLLIFGVGTGIWLSTRNAVSIVSSEPESGVGYGTRPVIRLASGEEICLLKDSVYNLGDGSLEDKGGYIRYQETADNKVEASELKYHEICVPKGAEYKMVLPDGTKVCLNAESVLRFPVSFSDNERRVTCDGEVFFDVAKDSLRPFCVESAGNLVKVLGTRFDIRHYEGEPYRAILLSGSIHLCGQGQTVLLNPGEQASLLDNRWVVEKADLEAIGWIDGYFLFKNCSLEHIMKELARWYNIEVFYADSRKQNEYYSFEIERSCSLKQVMEILRKTRTLDVEINGRTVIIR